MLGNAGGRVLLGERQKAASPAGGFLENPITVTGIGN